MARPGCKWRSNKPHLVDQEIKLMDAICHGKRVRECLDVVGVQTVRGADHVMKGIKRKLGARTLPHAVAIYCSKPDRENDQ